MSAESVVFAFAGENVAALEKQCADLEQDEKNLEKRIKKKKSDLERSEKRLKSLQTVRPAFMDEFDKQETELKRQCVPGSRQWSLQPHRPPARVCPHLAGEHRRTVVYWPPSLLGQSIGRR